MTVSIKELQNQLNEFYKEREWAQFHSPKNLVMALTGEVGELSEIFQWLSEEQSKNIINDESKAQSVKEELSDIFVYTITIADKLGIDLLEEAQNKISLNAKKYPVSKAKGNAKKYNEL